YIDIGSPNMPGGVQLLGTNQIIGSGSGTGSITLQHLTFNNSSTTLARDITVTGVMNMVSGKLNTSSGAVLILTATASLQSCLHDYFTLPYTNIGCDNSYIDGPVRKLGLNNEDFAFPTGVNGKLRPAFLRNATGDFTVQFVRGDPYLDISTNMGAGIHHISHLEYWNIAGTGNAKVEISYFDPNSGGVTDMNALRVVRFDGSQWTDQGVSSYLGTPGANGSITSNQVSQFGSFSLAGALGYPNNPLPLSLITFNAGTETDKISLNWVISNQQTYKYFTIEKEFPSGSFQSLSWINISQSTDNQQYNAIDPNPIVGKNRYRLRLTGMNGEIIFSEIATIIFKGQQQVIAYPNPAREKIFIKIPKSSSISEIAIVHISGSVIKWLKTSNQTALDVDIRDITRGIYYIKIIQAGYSTVIPIIKY
ncbi:MAG: T9SS type A sorting domain-containing protein, partial [Bacteroidetes bacterium]|nr:T9SS type A sorting domain-containing protein [Bacteroidota bacterium]